MNDLSGQDLAYRILESVLQTRALWFRTEADDSNSITMLLKDWTQIEDIKVMGERAFKDDPGPETEYWFSPDDHFKARAAALSANGITLAQTQIWLIFDKLPADEREILLTTDRPFGEIFYPLGMQRKRVRSSLSETLLRPNYTGGRQNWEYTFFTLESTIYVDGILVGYVQEQFLSNLLAFQPNRPTPELPSDVFNSWKIDREKGCQR